MTYRHSDGDENPRNYVEMRLSGAAGDPTGIIEDHMRMRDLRLYKKWPDVAHKGDEEDGDVPDLVDIIG
jgi:hypothetical protein